jgi:hypothetical protein
MLSPERIVLLVAVVVASFCGAAVLFQRRRAAENRKRHFIHLSGKLREYGFSFLPDLLEDLAISDFADFLAKSVHEVRLFLKSDDALLRELGKVFANIAGSAKGRKLIEDALATKPADAATAPTK